MSKKDCQPKKKAIISEVGYYYVIPAQLVESGDLLLGAVYGVIAYLASKDGYCYASNEYLGKRLKKCTRTITRYVWKLEKLGWISVLFQDKENKANIGRRIYLKTPTLDKSV